MPFIRRHLATAVFAAVFTLCTSVGAMAQDAEDDEGGAPNKTAPAKSGKASGTKKAEESESSKQPRRRARAKIARIIPNYAYIVADKSQFLGGYDRSFLNDVVNKVKRRRGVKKAEIMSNDEIRLEVLPKAFKSEDVIAGIEGVRIEMRVPYKKVELDVVEGATFPPRMSLSDEDVLSVEISPELRNAINATMGFNIPLKMRCVGNLKSPKSNEAALLRFETEKQPLAKIVPFMAVGDMDADKRNEVVFRFKGMPPMVVFQDRQGAFRVIPLSKPPRELTSIPRCEQNMESFVRTVPRKDVKCLREEDVPAGLKGAAFEVVQSNGSSRLYMWNGQKMSSCEPLGEGALPTENMTGESNNN